MNTQPLGVLIIINTAIVAVYCLSSTQVEVKRIVTLGIMGLLTGSVLIMKDRITRLKSLGFEMTTLTEQARGDAGMIASLRADLEAQKGNMQMIVRDANTAKTEIEAVSKLATDSKEKLQNAEQAVQSLNDTQAFSLLVLKANHDDRKAFGELLQIARSENGKFKVLADNTIGSVLESIDPMRSIRMDPDIPWKHFGLEGAPKDVTGYKELLDKVSPIYGSPLISSLWEDKSIDRKAKFELLAEIITHSNSLRAVHRACWLMNTEAKLNFNILGADEYLKWWSNHKSQF